ncbi:hypothetical protein J3458_005444 [Metarhizium acridum]|uniref:uncharacterized protein n=1 Tax=Metarhizium acridum TaxID=92637 RepID=UPI001C6B0C61|nr:hypothetical protein J3458_005444 [Metarhizium acridum]
MEARSKLRHHELSSVTRFAPTLSLYSRHTPHLPEATSAAAGRGSFIPVLLLAPRVLLLASTAAGDKNDGGTKEGEDGGDENEPDTGTPPGRADAVLIDIVLDDAEGHKVTDHGYQGDDKRNQRHEGGQEGANGAREDAEKAGDEAQARCHRVQNHNSREALGGAGRGIAKVAAVKAVHQTGRVIANPGVSAFIGTTVRAKSQQAVPPSFVSGRRMDADSLYASKAVTKGAKCDLVSSSTVSPEVDLHYREVVNHRGCDVHDDEKHKRHEEQKCADVVNEPAEAHLEVDFASVIGMCGFAWVLFLSRQSAGWEKLLWGRCTEQTFTTDGREVWPRQNCRANQAGELAGIYVNQQCFIRHGRSDAPSSGALQSPTLDRFQTLRRHLGIRQQLTTLARLGSESSRTEPGR